MAIKRDNILSLIGNGRYHSCILTTFSFDFYFFEMRAMKWLRSCGIRNVNVFIDGHYYSELMRDATGEEMKYATGYSIYPIFDTGIFHPKIWMLFGKDEGLLIVGSGNLTHPGNGNNDEIWGAYHFDIKSPSNASVVAAAWNYLSTISAGLKGIMADKCTRWIAENATWLPELPKSKSFEFSAIGNEEVAFLYNTLGNTIWKQVMKLIGSEKIAEVIAVSPYYDLQGKAIEIIHETYPSAELHIILDETGRVPSKLKPNRKYSFYHWKDMGICRGIGSEQKSRLHGKILVFKTNKGAEYCLFGSANITAAGLGLDKSFNAEACLFIHSNKGEIVNRLGIKLRDTAKKSLKDFESNAVPTVYEQIIRYNSYPVKLLSAELNFNLLTLYTDGNYSKKIVACLFNSNNILLKNIPIDSFSAVCEVRIDSTSNSFHYIQLLNEEGSPVSNKVIVTDYYTVAKTHPDPKMEELEQLCNRLQNGELDSLFDLIHYAILDETEKEEGTVVSRISGAKEADKKQASSDKLYDLAGYKAQEKKNFNEKMLLLSPSLRILDVLTKLQQQDTGFAEDIRDDEQEESIDKLEGNDEKEVQTKKTVSLRIAESRRRKLRNFFRNLYEYFHSDILYKDAKVSEYKLNLSDLTKYLIALELIHKYGGKFELIEDDQSQQFFMYLPATAEYENDNVKGCCLNIIGDFLRLARNGFKEYTFDYTKQKFEQLKQDALISTIACILNVAWRDNEQLYIKTLLLNTLHYLGWNTTTEIIDNIESVSRRVNEKLNKLPTRSARCDDQVAYFSNRVFAAFRDSAVKREMQQFATSASKGQIIYSSVAGVGYCYVLSVSATKEYSLARPGFDWNSSVNEFMNHFGGKVYKPLPLARMTIVDL